MIGRLHSGRSPLGRRAFVLVHGAWRGGWCWRRVADLLEAVGHKVFTPTLTGLGERAHLLSASVRLDTHVADIVGVLAWERLEQVVLVGHSYAGAVLTGVAERLPAALTSLVFLDAFVPEPGQSVAQLASPAVRQAIEVAVRERRLVLPPPPAAFFGVPEADRAWVDALSTPQPVATFTATCGAIDGREQVARKLYIRNTRFSSQAFDTALASRYRQAGWQVLELPCGHDAMIDMPDRLTEILLALA